MLFVDRFQTIIWVFLDKIFQYTLKVAVSVNTMANDICTPRYCCISKFHSLIRHRGHYDGCRMRSRTILPFRSTWFHLWFS